MKTQQSPVILDLCLRKFQSGIVVEKLRFQILSVKSVLEKLRFRDALV